MDVILEEFCYAIFVYSDYEGRDLVCLYKDITKAQTECDSLNKDLNSCDGIEYLVEKLKIV